MRIEILLIGDELLVGKTDPYPAAMIREVRGKGAYVSRIAVVPDNLDEIVHEMERAEKDETDLLIVTGGLGPTLDDVTRHALARFVGSPLVLDPKAERWVARAVLVRHGRMPEGDSPVLLMAKVPEGSEALHNAVGVACGIKAKVRKMTVVCLPGFPKEMISMFDEHVLPLIEPEGVIEEELWVMRRESEMEPLFEELVKKFEVRVASLPKENWKETGNQVILRGKQEEVAKAMGLFKRLLAKLPDP